MTFPLIISGPIVYNLQPPGNRILCHNSGTRFHTLISQILNISYLHRGRRVDSLVIYNSHVITSTAQVRNPSAEVNSGIIIIFIMLLTDPQALAESSQPGTTTHHPSLCFEAKTPRSYLSSKAPKSSGMRGLRGTHQRSAHG